MNVLINLTMGWINRCHIHGTLTKFLVTFDDNIGILPKQSTNRKLMIKMGPKKVLHLVAYFMITMG